MKLPRDLSGTEAVRWLAVATETVGPPVQREGNPERLLR